MNLEELVEKEIENGYGDVNARAKVCQDIILKAISSGSLNRNIVLEFQTGKQYANSCSTYKIFTAHTMSE